jgi:UDP-glucose 4-epimerase
MTILVTGGAGFIGSHVVRDLITQGHAVVVLDDLSGGFRENVHPQAIFVEGSILDTALLERVFSSHSIEHVFHLAAYAAEGLSHFIKRFNYQNNLIGSVNLINAAVNHGVKCFVFTSSIAVYGQNHCPMTEDLTPRPEDPYGIAKLAVEQELEICKRLFDLNHIIFRPHNVYGECQNIGDKYRNVVGIFMNQIMQDKPLTVFGDGRQTRAFTYIRDVSPVIARSILVEGAYNEVFNIGGDEVYTVRQLAEEVCRVMGVEMRIRSLAERAEVTHAYASHDKVKKVLGYQPRYTLRQGLENAARWARSVGPRQNTKFRNIEIMKNMPSSWLEVVDAT